MAIGILDYRTPAERQIATLTEPYDTSTGAPLPADVKAKVDALRPLIETERETNQKAVRDIVKKLGAVLEHDNDVFTQSMAAISLGRIASQTGETHAIKVLERDLKKERNTVREYEILALAIAKAPNAFEIAKGAVDGKNVQPTTQGAGLIALGILGDERGNAICKAVLEDHQNPMIRGYAAMAMGILGDDRSQAPILSMLKTTKSPDAMSSGALGLALLGRKQGSEILVKRLTETTNGDVAAFNVYSLGLMKDRTKIDALLEIATGHGNFFVQSAAVAAIGYVASAEDYPRRHLMARGFNYMLNLQLLENYFYKL
jgi:HEAT repeat protein